MVFLPGRAALTIIALVLFAAAAPVTSAKADTLESLTDPRPTAPGGADDWLDFTANSSSMDVSFSGYQVDGFEYFSDIGVYDLSSPSTNLLSQVWAFTPAASGSNSVQYSDGTSVNALAFGGFTQGSFDTYTQSFSATPGDIYAVDFNFADGNNGPSAFTVSTNVAATPLPGTVWVFSSALLGLIGVSSYRRVFATHTVA